MQVSFSVLQHRMLKEIKLLKILYIIDNRDKEQKKYEVGGVTMQQSSAVHIFKFYLFDRLLNSMNLNIQVKWVWMMHQFENMKK